MSRTFAGIVCLLALALAASGCFRTKYEQFAPGEPYARATGDATEKESGWQHFFIWGWAPGERRIDAQEMCEGTERIASIETRRTFAEGLVAALAGYYINIYSPYDGAVYCHPERDPDLARSD